MSGSSATVTRHQTRAINASNSIFLYKRYCLVVFFLSVFLKSALERQKSSATSSLQGCGREECK